MTGSDLVEKYFSGGSNTECPWYETGSSKLCTRVVRSDFHVLFLSISLGVGLPLMLIFFYIWFNSEKYTRMLLHAILTLLITLKSFNSIMLESQVILKSIKCGQNVPNVLLDNPGSCKLYATVDEILINLIYLVWLIEIIDIQMFVLNGFKNGYSIYWYSSVATGVTVIVSVIWIVVMSIWDNQMCWMRRSSGFIWINESIRMIFLIIQISLLTNVTVAFFSHRIGSTTEEARPARITTHIILILSSLFLLTFIFHAVLPDVTVCHSRLTYAYYTMDGLQDAVVSLVIFNLDPKIREENRKLWSRVKQWYYTTGCQEHFRSESPTRPPQPMARDPMWPPPYPDDERNVELLDLRSHHSSSNLSTNDNVLQMDTYRSLSSDLESARDSGVVLESNIRLISNEHRKERDEKPKHSEKVTDKGKTVWLSNYQFSVGNESVV